MLHTGSLSAMDAPPPLPPSEQAEILSMSADPQVWAAEFFRSFPHGAPDEGTMIGWFANAMAAGADAFTTWCLQVVTTPPDP